MNPDMYIKVKLKTFIEGGRKTNINGEYYSCPLIIDGNPYDCRMILKNNTIELGISYEIPVKLSNKDAVKYFHLGQEVIIWEGKEIGIGHIIEIL